MTTENTTEMTKLEELRTEATTLGLQFKANATEAQLQKLLDSHYATEANQDAAIVNSVDSKVKEELEGKAIVEAGMRQAAAQKLTANQFARAAEKEARKTTVVEIIDNDSRVNAHTTAVPVNCSNEYFDLGTAILPLNMAVEVMQGHLNVLREIEIPLHQIDPKTGQAKTVMRKRYSISVVK